MTPTEKIAVGVISFFEEWENKNIHIELRGDVEYIQMRRPDNDRPDTDTRQCLPAGNADVV